MSKKFTSGAIKRSMRRFTDYAGDLLKSDYDTFEDRLNMFMQFCTSDEVFTHIHQQLLSVPNAHFDTWLNERTATVGSFAGSGRLLFPCHIDERMSIMYQVLYNIYTAKISTINFAHLFFSSSSGRYDEYIYALNQSVTHPLVRELGYRLEELDEKLPTERTMEVPQSIVQIIHQATNVIQQHASGNNIQQNATISLPPELTALFTQLRSATASSELTPIQTKEIAEVIESAEAESSKSQPRLSVLRALFQSLPSSDTVLSITASIIDIVSNLAG